MFKSRILYFILLLAILSCKKGNDNSVVDPVPTAGSYAFSDLKVNGTSNGFTYYNLNTSPVVKVTFSSPINLSTASANITLSDASGNTLTFTPTLENNDNTLVLNLSGLQAITKYTLTINSGLLSKTGNKLRGNIVVNLITAIDDADKFARISDEELLTLVQKQTFKYFWDFGHPVSGMARERNTSGNTVTSGGTGFGIMAMIAGISRNFISRTDGLCLELYHYN